MEDTRDLKTLLELLLEEVKGNCVFGLCSCIGYMHFRGTITSLEHDALWWFRYYNRPKWYQYGYSFLQRNSGYWWKASEVKPRVKFLQHWIKKLS